MVSNVVYFASVLILVALINPAFGTECFSCQAELNQNITCETDVWNSRTNQNCSLGFVCSKYELQVLNVTTLYRQCSPEDFCKTLRAASEGQLNVENGNTGGSNQKVVSCFTCNNTLCNSVGLHLLDFKLVGFVLVGLVAMIV